MLNSTYMIVAKFDELDQHFDGSEGIWEMVESFEADIETQFNDEWEFFPCVEFRYVGELDDGGEPVLLNKMVFALFLGYDPEDEETVPSHPDFDKDSDVEGFEWDMVKTTIGTMSDDFFGNGHGYFDSYDLYWINNVLIRQPRWAE